MIELSGLVTSWSRACFPMLSFHARPLAFSVFYRLPPPSPCLPLRPVRPPLTMVSVIPTIDFLSHALRDDQVTSLPLPLLTTSTTPAPFVSGSPLRTRYLLSAYSSHRKYLQPTEPSCFKHHSQRASPMPLLLPSISSSPSIPSFPPSLLYPPDVVALRSVGFSLQFPRHHYSRDIQNDSRLVVNISVSLHPSTRSIYILPPPISFIYLYPLHDIPVPRHPFTIP